MPKGRVGKQGRGCSCKKSGCSKNYCDCYEAKVPCSETCKCMKCQNREKKNVGAVLHNNGIIYNQSIQSQRGIPSTSSGLNINYLFSTDNNIALENDVAMKDISKTFVSSDQPNIVTQNQQNIIQDQIIPDPPIIIQDQASTSFQVTQTVPSQLQTQEKHEFGSEEEWSNYTETLLAEMLFSYDTSQPDKKTVEENLLRGFEACLGFASIEPTSCNKK